MPQLSQMYCPNYPYYSKSKPKEEFGITYKYRKEPKEEFRITYKYRKVERVLEFPCHLIRQQ